MRVEAQESCMESLKTAKQRKQKLMPLLIVMSLVICIVVFWWLKLTGITVTGEAFCELAEHTHESVCYEGTLICPDETAEHIHGENCYESTLICTALEHIHTIECYSNMEADKESAEDWEQSFAADSLTQSARENLLYIAETQLGYKESEVNYIADENGSTLGYTRYGEWYGNPYGEWSAMLVSFCLNYAGIENSGELKNSGVNAMRSQWESAGLYEEAAFHSAEKGELVFIDSDRDGMVDSVGIVSDYAEGILSAIMGDWENAVSEVVFDDTSVIVGYGLTETLAVVPVEFESEEPTTQPEEVAEEAEEETTEAQEETTSAIEETTEAQQETTAVTESETTEVQQETTSESPTQEETTQVTETETQADLSALSEEDKERLEIAARFIEPLPTYDELMWELDRLYEEGDEDAEAEYLLGVQNQLSCAYACYQSLGDLQPYVTGTEKMFELREFYANMSTNQLVTETTDDINISFANVEWTKSGSDTKKITPIIVHGDQLGQILNINNYKYWLGIRVDYISSDGHYEVIGVVDPDEDFDHFRAMKSETDKGFVMIVWKAGSDATAEQRKAYEIAQKVEPGDYVDISFAPTLAEGYDPDGFGTISFSPPGDLKVDHVDQTSNPSDTQIDYYGGTVTSDDRKVKLSKTIDGTDIENVFDITLTVQTKSSVHSFLSEPDMAVVIVMDISNTMDEGFGGSDTGETRYESAIAAAEDFIGEFKDNTLGVSQIGFVAFNTSAHEIFPLQHCSTDAQVSTLVSEMKTETKSLMTSAKGTYKRFTNVEAGLSRGYDMLKESDNENKYIIFLSDGFPTTYLKDGTTTYEGYNPELETGTPGKNGVFYDYVKKCYCSGTSYSDTASIRARQMATRIKEAGTKIFAVGVDIGGQTVQRYVDDTGSNWSIVERTSTTYEIGDASSGEAYKNWLGNKIGSGYEKYYYDSNQASDLAEAFKNIFEEIRLLNKHSNETVWTTTDPLPVLDESVSSVDFLYFYDKSNNSAESLTGVHEPGAENTAGYSAKENAIHWDIKTSGYTKTEDGDTTYYNYTVTYRIRLQNEEDKFVEKSADGASGVYVTNGDAHLTYKVITTTNDAAEISDEKTVYFPKPSVHGYLSELSFTKQDPMGDPVKGAKFELIHSGSCTECQGDGTAVSDVEDRIAESTENGTVSFTGIPSGHVYTLTETVVPTGYAGNSNTYTVTVSYDNITVKVSAPGKEDTYWVNAEDYVIYNYTSFLLPETGGRGTLFFTISGLTLMAIPLLYCILRRRKERRIL